MLGSRKKPNEKLYAERIYEVADGEIGRSRPKNCGCLKRHALQTAKKRCFTATPKHFVRCWRWRTNNPLHLTRFYEKMKVFLKQSSREFRDVAIEDARN